MADDLDDDVTEEPDDLEAEVLDDDDALEIVDEVFVDEVFADAETDTDTDADADEEDVEVVVGVKKDRAPVAAKGGKAGEAGSDDEEAGEEDDDEPDPDDVEADLDTILKDRLVVADDEEDDEEEPPEPEDKAEGGKVRPRAPGEFVCQSCFLVKHPSQLADAQLLLCRDCV